jgi:hypothetical protein
MDAAVILLAAEEPALEIELLIRAGGFASVIALLGLLFVLPLYLGQRREIRRLLRWQELEPHRGDEGSELDVPAKAPAATTTATAATAVARPGETSPAARVTADRPALARITAERAAIESPSFWRRLIARGPRHPLVISILAVLLAVGAVAIVATQTGTFSNGGDEVAGGGLDRAAVDVVVLNGSSKAGLAQKVNDTLTAAGFEQIRTGATGTQKQTIVLFEKGNQKAARALKRVLGVNVIQPMDRTTRSLAQGADVVVVAGEDRARA